MLKLVLRAGLVVLFCTMVGEAAKPKPRTITLATHVTGTLSFEVADDAVKLTTSGEGQAGKFGKITAEASWAPPLEKVLLLLDGDIDKLSINTGSFSGKFENGDTVKGTLSGTVSPKSDTEFRVVADFTVTEGTGSLAGATGTGTLKGVLDVESLEFKANLKAKLAAK